MSLLQPLMVPVARRRYRLELDYPYLWGTPALDLLQIVVPAGTETDGNSVPRFAWSLFGIRPDGMNRAAGLVHDMLHRYHGRLPNLPEEPWLLRYEMREPQALDGLRASPPSTATNWQPLDAQFSFTESNKLYARMLRESGYGKARRRISFVGVQSAFWNRWKMDPPTEGTSNG